MSPSTSPTPAVAGRLWGPLPTCPAGRSRNANEGRLAQHVSQLPTARRLPWHIFQWGGARQHEIVFIFTAAFADEAAYEFPEQVIADDRGAARDLADARNGWPAPRPGRCG
jgi:hypothetical protein